MNCPNCNVALAASKRDNIDMEVCPSCNGMWLTREELEELEDEAFDLGDDKKGTLVFDSAEDTRNCPECGKPMNRFEYRFCDLEMDFCVEGHGFWLEAGEDRRVLELMKTEEANLERKVMVENRWSSELQRMRSGSFLDRLRRLLP
jgi:Zn-finger nucleic acid-binding protein